ncbi:LL-diaminopimelate aminotransferase [Methanomethylovorans hollandica DSM 15978]|uniref:Aminotransferase n=1 Tax=Methanomethylovorans hollandica (strain DSM 15978 / NBRC 107637 / DMS1) TaxID=867904 RepID=L0KX29_METHD|nr:LL-diaminopimelate aminotransferase [Methanomethylovorans hollandica]AGB49245.1 LL-diaminopimelate aminotransferase [Methanomethylovorans hollandica DSM 15978]
MYADRINALPPYLFAAIDESKSRMLAKGVDVIDLGVGDPDQPTPSHIVESMCQAVRDPATHRYPSYTGMLEFRKAAAKWCQESRDIDIDPVNQTLTLIGSKEGVAHIPLAFINPDDVVLCPDPGYPVYKIGTQFAGGEPFTMPLLEENGFLPDLDAIPADMLARAKMMFLNYPNNPTSATADGSFFKEVVEFAKDNDLIVVHDNAYSEMVYEGYKAPSFLNVNGAMEVGIELYSLSKTYNMTGWRLGFAVGNADLIKGLGKVKSNIDSGAFDAIQMAGITALTDSQQCVSDMNRIYEKRRDALLKGLQGIGLDVKPPKATFYVWAPVPNGYDSMGFSQLLLEEAGIVATPGVGFGQHGEGYIRFALTQSVDRINEAVARMEKLRL